ncbi:MAG TPA: hypothetical protein VF121_01270 [Thermoanaerobaculia bacterium]|nr:hypothetical protein [Thermoanaerobaculia bacterium]
MWSDDDARFVARFEAAALGHHEFGHREHLRVAWLYLQRHALEEALGAVRRGLRRISAAHGDPERYDEALTRAWVELVAEAMAGNGGGDFSTLLAAHPELLERETGTRRATLRTP